MRVINYSHMRQQETCEFEIYSHMTGNREKLFENIHFPRTGTRQRAHKYPNTCSVRGIFSLSFLRSCKSQESCALRRHLRCAFGLLEDAHLALWHTARQRLFDPPTRCSSRSNESKNKMHSLARAQVAAASFCFAHLNVHGAPSKSHRLFSPATNPDAKYVPWGLLLGSLLCTPCNCHITIALVSRSTSSFCREAFSTLPRVLCLGAHFVCYFSARFLQPKWPFFKLWRLSVQREKSLGGFGTFLNNPLLNF